MDFSTVTGSSLVDFAVSKLPDTAVKEFALLLLSSDLVPQTMFEGAFYPLSGFFSEEVDGFRKIKPEYQDLLKESVETRIQLVDMDQKALRSAIRANFQINWNYIPEILIGLKTGVIRHQYVPDQLSLLFQATDDNSLRAPKPEFRQLIMSVVVELYDIFSAKEG